MQNKIEISTEEIAAFERVMKLFESVAMDDTIMLPLRQFAQRMRGSLGSFRPLLQEVPDED